jgi:hypothetical protein
VDVDLTRAEVAGEHEAIGVVADLDDLSEPLQTTTPVPPKPSKWNSSPVTFSGLTTKPGVPMKRMSMNVCALFSVSLPCAYACVWPGCV